MNTNNMERPLGMVIGRLINSMLRVINARTTQQTETKLTIDQFGLLYAIFQKEEEVIQKDMAEIMHKDTSSILRMIDSLESKELVRRVVNANDRRKNHLIVTEKGEKAIESHLKVEKTVNDDLLEGLTKEDMDTFYKVLHHIQRKSEMM